MKKKGVSMENLIISYKNGIGIIQFNRPEKSNSINEQVIQELEEAVELFSRENIKVIVFRGNTDTFVSGGDLEQHEKMNGEQVYPILLRAGALLEKITQLDAITISAVQGRTIGGGCELAASCDFCFASESATFQFIQVRLGITTAWGGASRLMYKIGTKRALHLLLTGDQLSSKHAEEIGLVDTVYADEEFEKRIKKFTKKLADIPRPVLSTFKKISYQVAQGVPTSKIYPLEAKSCAACWDMDKHRRAVKFILSPLMKTEKS